MAQKRKARELTVAAARQITPNMRRLTLKGDDLASFPDNAEGSYFKLTFPGENPERPILRTYTVASFRPEQLEIDVDFMLHSKPDGSASGVAAEWSLQAKPGDRMAIFGPGPATFIKSDASWYLLAADMTALPALTANLERLPEDAKGYVVIEIMSEDDQQDLPIPASMKLIYVVNPQPGSEEAPLNTAIRQLVWLPGQVAVWTACEFKSMKKVREYYREQRSVDKSHLYISSYWKKGLQEEEHKVAKSEDSG